MLSSSYRVFIKYCVFSLKCCDFSELCQFCCSAGFLPAWCVYTHWHRGKTESGIFQKNRKKTQYLMNTLYISKAPIGSLLYHSIIDVLATVTLGTPGTQVIKVYYYHAQPSTLAIQFLLKLGVSYIYLFWMQPVK